MFPSFWLNSALRPCSQVAITLVRLTWVSRVSVRGKIERVPMSLIFSAYWGFTSKMGETSNYQITSYCPKQNFSSNCQLSEITTLKLLTLWGWVNSHRKAEKVNYDVSVEGFLRLHSNWDQKFRFLRMLLLVQNRFFSSLINIQNCITPKSFILSSCTNNR
jgi:hypothetical protein